jgi:DNA-binding transcriptional LysR family regulator
MDVNFELYKVFYYVAKNLSFSKASKKLFISQSAVSQSIKTLEKKLNTKLFYRNTKNITLTGEGKLLYDHIEPAINLINNGRNSIIESHSLTKGKLHIGASDTICKYYLIKYLKQFHEKYPNINIQVTNRTSIKCVNLLKKGEVDLIVTNLPNINIDSSMSIIPTLEFQDIFIASKKYFELNSKAISFEKLLSYPILMLEKNTTTSMYINELFNNHGYTINPSVELGSIDLLVELAKIGLGISFVPDYCVIKDETLLFSLNTSPKIPSRQLGIVTNKKFPISITAQRFIDMITI